MTSQTSNQPQPVKSDTMGPYLLMLRSRAKLTQSQLAGRIGVHRRSIQKWENGEAYPSAENLRALIILLIDMGAFTPGMERDEAMALWQSANQDSPHPLELFDPPWFDGLLTARSTAETGNPALVRDSADQLSASPAPPAADRQRSLGDTLGSPGRSLPFQSTSFIGRATELSEIARILSDPACRLLTLLGPGGIGKTRLALEVAAQQTTAYSDGVTFVALAPVGTPSQIVSAVGDALNLSFAGQPDPTGHLLGYLQMRHMLLLFDNFEHLLEGADLVYDILQHAPRVTILITSRERLNLRAEWLFNVEGLFYPSVDSPGRETAASLTELATYSAVQLFVQRAAQVQSGIPPQEATLGSIVRICQYVAGMPLAIELAAASVRILPIAEIERQIRSNLDVLATTLRDVAQRHRSLRAVFDQSWNLLSELERTLFSRLAVFRGGCTSAAAEQVTGATLQVMTTLVDKSLVRAETHTSAGHTEPRFALLEPLREYGWEKLALAGDVETRQRAHATYYLALAESVANQWDSPTADLSIERLDNDYDNLRSALQWARDSGDPLIGLQLAGALRKYWQRRGLYSEGRNWLEELLGLDDPAPTADALSIRALGLYTAAWLASDQHDFAYATQLFEQSMALRRRLGESEGETNLLTLAARQARAVGQYERATALLEEAFARHRAEGDRGSASTGGLGQSFYELALVLREQGDFARASALFAEGMNFHRAIGEQEGIAIGLMGLGDVARDQGNAAQLRTYSEQSLAISHQLGIQWAIGFALNNLALAAYLEGDLAQALSLARKSETLFREMKNDGGRAEVLITLGQILQAQEQLTEASDALTEALRLARVVGPHLLMAASLEGLATVIVQSVGNVSGDQRTVQAVRFLAAASAVRRQMGTPVRPIDLPTVERTLATARATLDADTFASIWSKAEEQSLEQMLATIPGAGLLSTGPALLTGLSSP